MLALSELSDAELLRRLASRVSHERYSTAEVLADLAEVDARKLYLPQGYPSMYAYCVEELRYSEGAALKRIQAARLAREFPELFTAVAEGRLHLTGVCLLAPHLTLENLDDLIAAATHKGKAEIETLLRRRFAPPELQVVAAAAPDDASPGTEHTLAYVATETGERPPANTTPAPFLAPAPERVALHLTVDRSKLAYAQALLSHTLPSGDVSLVMDRALDALIGNLEKRKFAATEKPGRIRASRASQRCVPAHVRRAVWERDQGRCTFVGESGHRCGATKRLEFDHIRPVARGGEASVEGMRLRCRGHNQQEAERTFGAEFMKKRREEAQRAREVTKNLTKNNPFRDDVIAGLRTLGVGMAEARRAVERVGTHDTLEETLRAALQLLGPHTIRMVPRNGGMVLART